MPEPARLDELERERFTNAVESAFEVSMRPKFFVWTQSAVQGVLSHEVLICGIVDGSRQGMALNNFCATRYFKQEHFDAVCDPATGLVPRLIAAADGRRSTVVTMPFGATPERRADRELSALLASCELRNISAQLVFGVLGKLEALLASCELRNISAQLVFGVLGKLEAVYAFARLKSEPDERTAYLTELLVPHVHSAFLRVLASERQGSAIESRRAGRLITERQEQILNLVKRGKTNSQIAEVLDCSPWTIKNHIQAILRKLDTSTRGHAIARAISLGILQSD